MLSADGIVEGFLARGWDSHPYEQLDEFFAADARGPVDLVQVCLDRLPHSVTFAADAISYVSAEQLAEVVEHAMQVLTTSELDGRTYPEEVIERVALQVPDLLVPHLGQLWDLQPNAESYTALWPWRAAGPGEIARLLHMVPGPDAARAVQAALEARDPAVVQRLLSEDPELRDVWWRVSDLVPSYGFDATGRVLLPDACFHMVPQEPAVLRFAAGPLREPHPTWLGTPSHTAHMGGELTTACAICLSPLHVLLELTDVPPGLGVSAPALTLATCLSCVGWSAKHIFMAHADGAVEPVFSPPAAQPEFPSVGLKRQEVGLVSTAARWREQDWGVSNSRENLNRLGGAPTWVQSADYPSCPGCGRTMAALMQLDTGHPMADGGELYWGSGGLGYVTWCDGCSISAVAWQCT